MINIQLHNDCPATDTIVPNQFIDRFMPSANGEFVKVYLYLLRCIHSHASNCTISEIADKFNNTEMDIQRIMADLRFLWQIHRLGGTKRFLCSGCRCFFQRNSRRGRRGRCLFCVCGIFRKRKKTDSAQFTVGGFLQREESFFPPLYAG